MAEQPEETRIRAVRGYVSAVVDCPPDRITAVERFEEGNRHHVDKVSYLDPTSATMDLVVRISYGGSPAECARAEGEAKVLERTGGVAAPLLYDFRSHSPWFETPVMCMQLVPGETRRLSSVAPAELERLGSLVAWVHGRPADDLADRAGAPDDIAAYAEWSLQSVLSGLVWGRDPLPDAIQGGLRHSAALLQRGWTKSRLAPEFRTGGKLALLHGDIGPGNILWGPDPVLVDWEYARPGDPADEIAYLFDQHGLAEAQRGIFWRGYRAGVGNRAPLAGIIDRVTWWEPLTLLGSALWWVERWVRRVEADAVSTVGPRSPGTPPTTTTTSSADCTGWRRCRAETDQPADGGARSAGMAWRYPPTIHRYCGNRSKSVNLGDIP